MKDKIAKLKRLITENLRVQSGGAEEISYVDTIDALPATQTRQNHVIFARRGCGKTLLLHAAAKKIPKENIIVYLNCEDYKNHSFPNIIIEILDGIFFKIESSISRIPWGNSRKAKNIILKIRKELAYLREKPDERHEKITETTQSHNNVAIGAGIHGGDLLDIGTKSEASTKAAIEKQYRKFDSKIETLNRLLPQLKTELRNFFKVYSKKIKNIFLQIDDFYHVQREMQPYVVDYIHRFCKDLPIFFKIATLKHASTLYIERSGQPIGAQERHDYQPIQIDFTFQDFIKTEGQIKQIFYKFGELADMSLTEINKLFKGDGFRRLVLAGGGVPRDCLSLFLAALSNVKSDDGGQISKDDIRTLSFSAFAQRIRDLKNDSQPDEQSPLVKGIYVIRNFCMNAKRNIFVISENLLQENEQIQQLIYKLLDYRIIYSVDSAFTHKSTSGTFHAFMIDIGSYANYRKLYGKMEEIDLSEKDSKEKIRSAPILTETLLRLAWTNSPENLEKIILEEEPSE